MTYQDAQVKLLAYVRDRLHNGELTERGLARLIGISQPHVHNVLNGARNLSPKILDSILKYLHMSLLDLASAEELEAALSQRNAPNPVLEIAFLDSPIGPGKPWPAVSRRHSFPVPSASLTSAGLVMARLAADPLMSDTLAGFDIALLDTSERLRSERSPDGLYVVSQGDEALLRYVRPGAYGFYLATDASRNKPEQWERLRVSAVELFERVKARVRWLGRERDRDRPARQPGRFLYDAIS